MGLLHNKEDAEKITQDVFVKVYQSLAAFNGRAAFATWLYRIAVNTSLNLYSILGGFHLRYCSDKQYNFIVNYLRPIPAVIIKACHCSGIKKFSSLQGD